jgi:hypothetical protein
MFGFMLPDMHVAANQAAQISVINLQTEPRVSPILCTAQLPDMGLTPISRRRRGRGDFHALPD